MQFSSMVVLLTGALAFANVVSAQSGLAVSDEEAPVLTVHQPSETPDALLPQAQTVPPPSQPPVQTDLPDARSLEDRFRLEIKALAHKKHQFVHRKLKNGKVLTGTIRDAGYEAFTLHTNALGEGTYIYYKDVADLPRAVPAVGTRFKQGAQWFGFGVLLAAVVPLAILLAPFGGAGILPDC